LGDKTKGITLLEQEAKRRNHHAADALNMVQPFTSPKNLSPLPFPFFKTIFAQNLHQ
jgi:hypothetical protein